jgi:hypothetical protein
MKKIIVILSVVALVVAALGGFVYAQDSLHEPMTGQKLVGWSPCMVDADIYFEGILLFTNPDCVSEITIEQLSIIAHDGTVIHEGELLDREGNPLPQTLGPHGVGSIVLSDYVARYYELDPCDYRAFPPGGYTVEIFWTKSDKKGLPLIGSSITNTLTLEEGTNVIIGQAAGWSTEMVNMEQVLKKAQ